MPSPFAKVRYSRPAGIDPSGTWIDREADIGFVHSTPASRSGGDADVTRAVAAPADC